MPESAPGRFHSRLPSRSRSSCPSASSVVALVRRGGVSSLRRVSMRRKMMESVLQEWQNLHMTDLNEIAVFVSVAQLGSFTRAARALAMPVSTVSRRIADLERQLGVTLIQRTTRKLTLTTQGRDYFDQCSEPLAHLYDAECVLTGSQRQPEGNLRISVPVILGDPVFLGFLSDFLRNYPRIRLDLFITNQMLDLVGESIDVALRFGELKSSSIVARRLGITVRYVVAAPAYLAGRARPREPAELAEHACVLLQALNNEAEWELVNDRRRARVRVMGAVASRDFQSVSFFVDRGHGIGLMPSTYCDSQIEKGALVRLLPKWSSPRCRVTSFIPRASSCRRRCKSSWKHCVPGEAPSGSRRSRRARATFTTKNPSHSSGPR